MIIIIIRIIFYFFTCYLLLLDETDPSCICDVNLCSGLTGQKKKSEMFKYSNVTALVFG